MALLDFYIRNQKLSKIGPKLVADSVNYVDCSFTFKTDDWNGLDKWVVFSKGEESYRVNLVDDSIPEEAGLNLGAGLWFVSLFGENAEGTKRITTNSVTVEVAKSTIQDGEPLPPIALTEAEQIAAKAQRALDAANEVKSKAENGDFDGKPGEPGKDGENATPEQIAGAVENYFEENPIPGGDNAEVSAESIEKALGYVPANPKDIPTVPTNVSAFNNDAGYAKKTELPTKTSELENDSGFITVKDIPAPPEIPVKSVNGKTGAVQLTASDVGAHPNTWKPTPEEIGAMPESYSPTYEDVGADKEGKAVEEVSKHNTSENAHNDIRVELTELRNALEAFLDIDDPTLDQLSELIQKIEANAGTITELTNGKVNVADIINNLTTNVANKPLSAAQGVVLKGLVDELDTVAKGAKSTAETAKTTADEAKILATAADTNAKNASDKVDNLEERMDSGEFKGEPGTPGADGVSIVSVEQTTTSSADGGENVVTVTLSNGVKSTFKFKNGSKGSAGEKGNGIKSAVLNADYTLTLTFDDGTEYTTPSIRGAQGPAGTNATITGASATVDDNVGTPSVEVSMGGTASARSFVFTFKNLKGKTGATGPQGIQGEPGPQGPAYTLTEADKAEIVRLVHESIGTPVFGVVEEDNTVILSGNLRDGTFYFKYIMENGTLVDIGSPTFDSNTYYSITKNLTNCTINNSATKIAEGESYSATISAKSGYELKTVTVTMGGAAVTVTNGVINIASVTGNIVITAVAEASGSAYINQIPISTDASGNPYNGGQGWKTGYRLNSTGAEVALAGIEVTGFIPFKLKDTIYIKNITDDGTHNIALYDASYTKLATMIFSTVFGSASNGEYMSKKIDGSVHTQVEQAGNNIAFIRLCADEITANSIITVNEPIV